MTSARQLTRRAFLAGGLALGAAGATWWLLGRDDPSRGSWPHPDASEELVALGAAVLAVDPGAADAAEAVVTAAEGDEERGRQLLQAAIEADVREEAIVEIEGWILPSSLAGIAALAAIDART